MTESTDPTDPAAPVRRQPPLVSDETTGLRAWLDFHRDTFRAKTTGLSAEALHAAHPPSSLTLGGLIKHLAYVEDNWFGVVLLGRDPVEPWRSAGWDADHDWEFTSSAADSPAELSELWEASVRASETILADTLATSDLDILSVRPLHGMGPCDLRWILVHLIEEYARHNGHADLLREAVDGAVGV